MHEGDCNYYFTQLQAFSIDRLKSSLTGNERLYFLSLKYFCLRTLCSAQCSLSNVSLLNGFHTRKSIPEDCSMKDVFFFGSSGFAWWFFSFSWLRRWSTNRPFKSVGFLFKTIVTFLTSSLSCLLFLNKLPWVDVKNYIVYFAVIFIAGIRLWKSFPRNNF